MPGRQRPHRFIRGLTAPCRRPPRLRSATTPRSHAIEEGKPEQAITKIVEGRTKGYHKRFCPVEQPWVRDNKKTIGAYLEENGGRSSNSHGSRSGKTDASVWGRPVGPRFAATR